MTAPKVNIKEQDISTVVPSSQGVYGGIVIPAPKGEVGVPRLITSDKELLKFFTPDETIKVGYNMAFYSALTFLGSSSTLHVVRADNGSQYGGVILSTSVGTNNKLTAESLGTIALVDKTNSIVSITGDISERVAVGDYITISGSTGNDGKYMVSAKAFDDTNTNLTLSGSLASTVADGAVHLSSLATPENYSFNATEALLITGANQGTWANDIAIKLYTYASSPLVVKESENNAFMIQVYKYSTNALLETFICSRDTNAKDGYGNNIYVEDVINGVSNYIKVVDNTALASSTLLKEQTSLLQLDGAIDGASVTDSTMISALQALANKNDVRLKVLMDGGWATSAYHLALDTLCKNRQDCVACLSTPYASEIASDYITAISTYRNTTLNLNSSYSALYTPHVLIADRFNDRNIYVSPDGYAASAIASTASNFEIWFAPAGYRRGTISVSDVRVRFTDGELDSLYDIGVNPIKFKKGKGIAIFGQKTLSSRPSATDRLNVRLLLTTIEPDVAEFLEDFLFEFNDEFTRRLVKSGIDDYMDGIKSRRGVYDYATVCDSTNNSDADIDNNIMNVDLYVQPTRTAEFINLTAVITRTGYTLTVA